MSFNDLEGLRDRVATAVRNARLVGEKEISLAPVEPVVDIVPPLVEKDPMSIPLSDKKKLLDQVRRDYFRDTKNHNLHRGL